MAVLHKEFTKYNKEIKLSSTRKESLKKSSKELRKKIRKWFSENKPNELEPKFQSQGSMEMNTTTNPIVLYDEEGNPIRKFDLDDGVYFIEKVGEDNKRNVDTWHDWIFQAVENHTGQTPIRKTTCIRVVFTDGHHIDLPIYYKKDTEIELAHRSDGFIESDPKAFSDWFNDEKNSQLEKFVRYLKGWKNFREWKNSSLKLPSGFELTILLVKYYVEKDNDDEAFRETIREMDKELNKTDGFKCIRPTAPKGENVFDDYSDSRKSNFLNSLSSLLKDLDRADDEQNFKMASEILRNNQFGERFPLGEDKDQETKSELLANAIGIAAIKPKPYGY